MKKKLINSNRERAAYWKLILIHYSEQEIETALGKLNQDYADVLRLHYCQHIKLKEIASMLDRSITVVRNHHNRGIYKLFRYFNPRKSENS